MSGRTSMLVSLCASLAMATACAAATLEFDTMGGDAWVFELPMSGTIHENCDRVIVESAHARVNATIVEKQFFTELPLHAGNNSIRATCERSGRKFGSVAESNWRLALKDGPKARVRIRIDGSQVHLDAGASERAAITPVPFVEYRWSTEDTNAVPLTSVGESHSKEHITFDAPKSNGDYYVRLDVRDALGRTDVSRAAFRVVDGKPETVSLADEHPAWLDSAVLYGAAPYMFSPPSFEGVRERIDDIAALGATAVWLSPVTKAAPDDFGYAVTDQFGFRDAFGGEAVFRSLVDTAHRMRLRVLVDFVPNHFSQFHAYHLHAVEHGKRSPYYDWFERDAAGNITQYFDWAHLKNLNFDNPAVRNHIIAAAARFVRDFGVDGFRIDASWAVASRAPEFWPQLRAELKRIDPDIVLIAEASAREAYHVANGFDAAYDWTANLGQWAWHDVFGADGTVDLARLRRALTNDDRGYPEDSLILRFLNNNDTGERIVSRLGMKTAALAATLEFTLPGIPLVYNGDEQGAEFLPYDEGPPLVWKDNELTAHYRKLAQVRRDSPALRSRELQLIDTNRDRDVLAYLRPSIDGHSRVLALLNFSDQPLEVKPAMTDLTKLNRDLLSNETIRFTQRNTAVRIPAKSALLLASR